MIDYSPYFTVTRNGSTESGSVYARKNGVSFLHALPRNGERRGKREKEIDEELFD